MLLIYLSSSPFICSLLLPWPLFRVGRKHARSLAGNRGTNPCHRWHVLRTLKSESHSGWQAPFPWLSRKSPLLTPVSEPQCSRRQCATPSPCTCRETLLNGWVLRGKATRTDNTPPSIPNPQGSQELTPKFHMDKKWGQGDGGENHTGTQNLRLPDLSLAHLWLYIPMFQICLR